MIICKSWIAPIALRKNLLGNTWVQWVHQVEGIIHCFECLKLDGCYFLRSNAPSCPHHQKCHCELKEIDYSVVMRNAAATSNYKKFIPYLFNTNGWYNHGKEKLFEQWGYTAEDAKWLQTEMEKQALEKYLLGDYSLGRLDIFGQRINITIEIPKKDGSGIATFISGWMVEPSGKLKLITPYGGK